MNTYIALFRGINVGGKNLLPMKDLVAIFKSMNYANIQTYIQSGNVIFQSKDVVSKGCGVEIGKRVFETMGFAPKVLIITAAELQQAFANNPFTPSDGKALHFFFLDSPPLQPDIAKLAAIKTPTEEFKLTDDVFYLYAPGGIGRSKLAAEVEKALGIPVTARNWNTVGKLLLMVEKL